MSTTKFEDAVVALKAKNFDSPEMLQVLELMVEQNERIKNVEHASLESRHRHDATEDTVTAHGVSIGSLAQDRDTQAKRISEIVAKPEADEKRIKDLETRVTTVEGAIGSKAYRRNENAKVVEPLPADPPKHSILPSFMQSDPKPPVSAPVV